MMTMKTKRIASLLLSAALLLSLAVPAFAENPTTEETAEPETAVQEVEPEALTEEDAVVPVAEPTAKKEYTYVAIGDSVTAGVGLSGLQYKLVQNGFDMSGNYKGYDGQCFVGYVADQLGLDRDHAINYGMPAAMSGNILDLVKTGSTAANAAYYTVPQMREDLANADLITVLIGSNDTVIRLMGALGKATNGKSTAILYPLLTGTMRELNKQTLEKIKNSLQYMNLTTEEWKAALEFLDTGVEEICSQTRAETLSNLEQIVQELQALNPDAQIVLLGYYNPLPVLPGYSSPFCKLNRDVKALAQQYGVDYVSIPLTLTANDGHPTIAGHRYIARQILKAVKD